MKIFSLLPAYSNPQTNNKKNLSNSQKPQQAPKLRALSHDQVSFKRDVEIKDLDGFVRVVCKDLNKFFPELKKSEKKYTKDLLICKIVQKPVVIRLWARQQEGSTSPELVIQVKHKLNCDSWDDIPILPSDIIPANDLTYDNFRKLINQKVSDFKAAQ